MFIKKFLIFFIITFLNISCTLNKIEHVHGVNNLKKKYETLIVQKTNKNDIVEILGPAPLENQNKWTYFEVREKKNKFGKRDIYINDHIEITFDKYGILKSKKFLTIDNMNQIKFSEIITKSKGVNETLSKDILSSTRKRMESARKKMREELDKY